MTLTHAYQIKEGDDWVFCTAERSRTVRAFRVVTEKRALKEIADKMQEDLRKRVNASVRRFPGRVPASKRPEGVPEDGFYLKKDK